MRRRSEDEQAVAAVIQARVAHSISKKLHLEGPGSEALGAWFLGPKAENADLLLDLIADSVKAHVDSRKRYYPNDPEWITAQRKSSPAYQQATAQLSAELTKVLETLDASVPFYSYRYQGHMLWDVTLPAVLGYFASLLYNQNNVAAEASPVTTWLEMLVGDDLCRMLGYYVPKRKCDGSYEDPAPGETVAWGHVTCGGTVANCESIWAARNAKYLPLGVAAALTNEQALAPARDLEVKLPTGESRPLVGLDPWTLLNIEADVALSLSEAIKAKVDKAVDVSGILERYTLQHLGLVSFLHKYAPYVEPPVFLMPATAHYSWPKGASLVGLGRHSAIPVPTDLDCRLDMGALRVELERCFQERKPVLMVVVVLGTTEQSAVDPLHEVLALREEYRKKGFDFWVHVDAAWGGYFASLLRPAENAKGRLKSCTTRAAFAPELANELVFDPHMVMSHYVTAQYEELGRADSITVDPHKAGYAPYPAGGLCYRNGAMRHLVAFTSPVIHHGEVEPTIGIYGIEGSKPGAAATAVYLSHRVVRPDQSGYGRILGRCLWNSKRVYCALVTMERQDDPFVVAAL